jgi:threonine dehydrogenase-like Zn-dependent dehydrogenase
MRALVFDGGLSCQADRPVPEPAPGEARIRVRLAGICATDLAITRGYMGFAGVLGHEFVGAVDAGPAEWLGRRVVGEINAACGRCATCARGLGRHCPDRTVLGIQGRDGAFAEYLILPVGNLHPVPDAVPDAAAVFVEPLAAAFRIREQVQPQTEDAVQVLGDGRLGLLIAQVLAATGCRLTLVGRHPAKLALAREWGIETADTSVNLPPADLVVDATGAPDGLVHAIARVRPCGTVVLKTTCAESPPFNPAPLVIHEVTVIGSRCGPFPPALAALASGSVRVAPLVAATYPLTDGAEAFAHAARPGVLKVLLAP